MIIVLTRHAMTTETALLDAINRLTAALQTSIPIDKRLWGSEQCAQYLCYATPSFLRYIACRPDFPKPLRLSEGDKARRWRAQDVIDWAESQRS